MIKLILHLLIVAAINAHRPHLSLFDELLPFLAIPFRPCVGMRFGRAVPTDIEVAQILFKYITRQIESLAIAGMPDENIMIFCRLTNDWPGTLNYNIRHIGIAVNIPNPRSHRKAFRF